jgi:hypothetical protein
MAVVPAAAITPRRPEGSPRSQSGKRPWRAAAGALRLRGVSNVPFRQLLRPALAGDNACAICGGAVPVSSRAIKLLERLHRAGRLEAIEPEGVRMMLVLGSLEAGCGMAEADAQGRVRVSCPWCASPDEQALAREVTAGGLAFAGMRDCGSRGPGLRRWLPAPLQRAW